MVHVCFDISIVLSIIIIIIIIIINLPLLLQSPVLNKDTSRLIHYYSPPLFCFCAYAER
jgi:hypothetical protein